MLCVGEGYISAARASIESILSTHQENPVEDVGIRLTVAFECVTAPSVPVMRSAHRILVQDYPVGTLTICNSQAARAQDHPFVGEVYIRGRRVRLGTGIHDEIVEVEEVVHGHSVLGCYDNR